MIRVNIHKAKTHLSRLLEALKPGEKIMLCNRNIPVAEILSLPKVQHGDRPLGLAEGEIHFSKSAFQPLPKSFIQTFYR